MGGLSYFDEGGQTEPEAQEPVVQAEPTAGKGRIQYPKLSGTVPVGRSTLEAMEEMYQSMLARQQGLSGFLESAKDAQAWWTPGGAERNVALARRSQTRDQQASDLFNMRSQIAQYRAAMEQQDQFNRDKSGLLGTAGPSLTAAGLDLQPHEELALSRARTRADFDKLLNGFIMERTKGLSQPGASEAKYDVLIDDGEGGAIHDIVDLATKNRLRREGRLVEPGGAPKAQAPAPSLAAAPAGDLTAQDRGIPAAAVTPPAAAVTPPAAAVTPPAAAVTPPAAAAPGSYNFKDLTPQQLEVLKAKGKEMGLIRDDFSREDAAQLFDKMPLDKRKGFFDALGPDASVQPRAAPPATAVAPPAPPAAAVAPPTAAVAPPAAAVAPPARQRPPTLPQIRAQQELDRQRAGERAKTEAESEKTHNEAAKTAGDRENTSSEIINILTQDRSIAGILQKPGVPAALATLLQTGISAPGGHSIGVKEIDEVLFKGQKNLTQEQVNARDRLRSLLDKTSLDYASVMKGQGSVTQFERELLQRMVGSVGNTPENIIKIHRILRANAGNRREIDQMYKRSNMAWGDFVKSEQYINHENNYNEKLRQLEKEPVKFAESKESASNIKNHPGKALLDLYPARKNK